MTSMRVAMIGYGFMGAAHSQGWRVAPRFFDLPATPEMTLLVGRNGGSVASAAQKWGWAETSSDWREAIARDDIDVIDIVTPGDSHAEIAIAALDAGKHVLCEKPLANSVAEAEQMAAAAERAAARGVLAMVGFTYRRVPAATFARRLVADGAIGEVRSVRAEYLQDWLVDETVPLAWRLQKEHAGSGALGDIGAHAIDLAQFITGQRLTSVAGTIDTVVAERPLLAEGSGLSGTAGAGYGAVTVDDVALFSGRFEQGALGAFVASRMSTGRKNALRIEVSGSRGAIAFDLEDMNSLGYYDDTAPADRRGFTKILVTEPQHPYIAAWWPAGHMLGYEHGFAHQAKDFVEAIAAGAQPTPSFADGLQVQRVLGAVEQSSGARGIWTTTD
ncbi:Gfo/Idh/MocA family protein [Agromyces ramosus]|uniref:Dehydrogenase n=1 Tax=Agromyces ramosus TaxID=33879 RepID=A0ABU0R842_9MICO|nr:Gfo/Idh/MocA family oxidoreductase [Agromyces ramosus]MDQ0894241.1 putative dehydrogenase [Agromyces ramosus]